MLRELPKQAKKKNFPPSPRRPIALTLDIDVRHPAHDDMWRREFGKLTAAIFHHRGESTEEDDNNHNDEVRLRISAQLVDMRKEQRQARSSRLVWLEQHTATRCRRLEGAV